MSGGRNNLTGQWEGTFSYPDVPEAGPITPFLATITDSGGVLQGTVIEPNEFHPGTAHAALIGQRIGHSVHFAKSYQSAGAEYRETVLYYGSRSDDGETITGQWQIGHWCGPFEMVREFSADVVIEETVEAHA